MKLPQEALLKYRIKRALEKSHSASDFSKNLRAFTISRIKSFSASR
ncbi:hypothetical protein KVF11_05255 [Helicobacter pylori]|nr:hypothetical protein KVF11_05255 [Helicobacter pylori]